MPGLVWCCKYTPWRRKKKKNWNTLQQKQQLAKNFSSTPRCSQASYELWSYSLVSQQAGHFFPCLLPYLGYTCSPQSPRWRPIYFIEVVHPVHNPKKAFHFCIFSIIRACWVVCHFPPCLCNSHDIFAQSEWSWTMSLTFFLRMQPIRTSWDTASHTASWHTASFFLWPKDHC